MSSAPFADALLAWWDVHGRKDLPWQRDPTPYRVWVSEVMLQQTQVATVVPYFERFTARLPTAAALAAAPLDQVLALWAGLGYYSRARNLHRAARLVQERWGGQLPTGLEDLQALPGIGRSTAGAILALACGQRHAILDGNVKRVLARFHCLDDWPGEARVQRRLWEWSEACTPTRRVAHYTQAIMDLGATVCTRRRPSCGRCPLAAGCRARLGGVANDLPAPRPRRTLPLRETVFVLATDPQGRVYLERRPPAGVWGGLWALPECRPPQTPESWCRDHLRAEPAMVASWPVLRHVFSHFRLDIRPVRVWLKTPSHSALDGDPGLWYKPGDGDMPGLPAPMARLLDRLGQQMTEEGP